MPRKEYRNILSSARLATNIEPQQSLRVESLYGNWIKHCSAKPLTGAQYPIESKSLLRSTAYWIQCNAKHASSVAGMCLFLGVWRRRSDLSPNSDMFIRIRWPKNLRISGTLVWAACNMHRAAEAILPIFERCLWEKIPWNSSMRNFQIPGILVNNFYICRNIQRTENVTFNREQTLFMCLLTTWTDI